jgi:hypothetical protein
MAGMAKKMYAHHIETIRPEDLPIMLAKHGNLGNRLASMLERPDGTLLLIFEYEIEVGNPKGNYILDSFFGPSH